MSDRFDRFGYHCKPTSNIDIYPSTLFFVENIAHKYRTLKLDHGPSFLADLKNQPVGSLCVTHILPFCSRFKGQEQIDFKPTSWNLVACNFL